MQRRMQHAGAVALVWVIALALSASVFGAEPFGVQVIDEATGRGVPLVELETTNRIRFVTDSQGWVAIDDPDLLGQKVYFAVKSHGYEIPADGFGYRGKALQLQPGGREQISIKRKNLAERLRRLTGGGIDRDSVMLGEKSPLQHPLLNANVFGCDSVMSVEHRGKLYWFWGDTLAPTYPIGGNFHVTGATSDLPGPDVLPPAQGVNYAYITQPDGRVKPMAPMSGEGPTWICSVTELKDDSGKPKIYAGYIKVRNFLESYCWGFVVWNDEEQVFEHLSSTDEKPVIFPEPQTHTFLKQDADGTEYVYFGNPLPLTRVKATPDAFLDPTRYEGYSCLQAGTQLSDGKFDHDADGRLRYGWKVNTPPFTQYDETKQRTAGVLTPADGIFQLRDVETDKRVAAHLGSVYWNEFRKRWVLIVAEAGGSTSYLGEIWFAEADDVTGPWVYAKKIVTHDKMTFYNPKQHPFFDEEGGRRIYFEGTYTQSFSNQPDATPRYEYNQVLYRLDLSLPELNLPVPFAATAGTGAPFAARTGQPAKFFALVKPGAGTVPISWDGHRLSAGSPEAGSHQVQFHAWGAEATDAPAFTVPLYEFRNLSTGEQVYQTAADWNAPGFERQSIPVCRVWPTPGCGDVLP